MNEILGNSYRYMIDKSHNNNNDGFIAVGAESIVYKGLKTQMDGGMQFSCVLKFKPKRIEVNGEKINRRAAFDEEWKIFEELRECRSIVRIDDVIDDLGDFYVVCDKADRGFISGEYYFCVVEEFIDGWTLKDYCLEEYWKLAGITTLPNDLKIRESFEHYGKERAQEVLQSYQYENILKFQNQILLFMKNLCEILQFVSEQKKILHLDIKPENIMVTRHGNELVLIDFGKSKKVTAANRFVMSNLPPANYQIEESTKKENIYAYGSLGYAAPECYAEAKNGSQFPFPGEFTHGKMSIESDIFSFGATFWECLNLFELVTKYRIPQDIYNFYAPKFPDNDLYFDRDLSCTSLYYHKKLENIIKKCTRRRIQDYTESKAFYHSYAELEKDVQDALNSVPVILKEENVKAKHAFSFSGFLLALFTVFLVINFRYHNRAFEIAERKWEEITAEYNDTQISILEEIAEDMIDAVSAQKEEEVYRRIADFTYKDGEVSEYEAQMLVNLLLKTGNEKIYPVSIDQIMRYANEKKYKEVSAQIMRLGKVENSDGYTLARAIFDVEVSKTNILQAYEILLLYRYDQEYRNAVIKLKNVLDRDDYISVIAEGTGESRQKIKEILKAVTRETQS